MVLCGNICSSGFYSDGFHVRGAEWREKKKGLSWTNLLVQVRELQSVSRSVAKTLNHFFLFCFFLQRLKK